MADDLNGTDAVPTWREGIVLTREEKAELTPEQWAQYADASVVRDLDELEDLPEPSRSWAQEAVRQARARAERRISGQSVVGQERREAS